MAASQSSLGSKGGSVPSTERGAEPVVVASSSSPTLFGIMASKRLAKQFVSRLVQLNNNKTNENLILVADTKDGSVGLHR